MYFRADTTSTPGTVRGQSSNRSTTRRTDTFLLHFLEFGLDDEEVRVMSDGPQENCADEPVDVHSVSMRLRKGVWVHGIRQKHAARLPVVAAQDHKVPHRQP